MTPALTPIILLTGFLGSGKTSLLRRLVRQPAFARCAVVINEFGDVGLDQALVADQSDDRDIRLLDSGCLCCLASTSIQDTLASLHYRRMRQEIPWFDSIVIETSGLAEPGPIINAIYGDNTLTPLFRLSAVVTTFDSGFGTQQTGQYREAKLQLMMADAIVVTKGDLHGPIDSLVQTLHAMHPTAEILSNQLEDGTLARAVLDAGRHRPPSGPATPPVASAPRLPALRHVLAYGIHSVSVRIDRPVGWPAWANFVHHVQRDFAHALLRFKGVLAFAGEARPMAVHAVHHLFSAPEPVDASPQISGKLVFIVQDLERARVESAVQLLRDNQ